jgi:hypothetical protein
MRNNIIVPLPAILTFFPDSSDSSPLNSSISSFADIVSTDQTISVLPSSPPFTNDAKDAGPMRTSRLDFAGALRPSPLHDEGKTPTMSASLTSSSGPEAQVGFGPL